MASVVTDVLDGVAVPGAATDVLGGLSSSVAVKGPCVAATTASIAHSGLQTIDGVVLVEGDRVLDKDNADATQRGIWIASTGNWGRTKDFSRNDDILTGTLVYVSGGSANVGVWVLTTTGTITIDTASLTFATLISTLGFAPLASPPFTGNPTAPTQAAGNNSTRIATTEFVEAVRVALLGGVAAMGDTLAELYALVTDSDLVAIAALATTAYGRSLLALAGASSLFASETIAIAVSDETTAITTGTAKVTFRMPYAFTITSVKASLSTASSSGLPTFDINEGGVTILSTKLSIDANEKTSVTAATAAVVSDAALAADAEMTIDIDVAGTGAKGAKVYLIGYRTA
jgi:hypothetical protein